MTSAARLKTTSLNTDATFRVPPVGAGNATETCPQCHTTTPWEASSWCPDCGYYPGITDAVPTPDSVIEDKSADLEVAVEAKPPLLPIWVTASIGGATAIVVASIAARYYFTYFGGDRSLWSFLIFVTGLAATIGAHVRSAIASMKDSSDVSPLDVIMHPIEMWRSTIRGLPKTGGRIVSGVCGMTAVLSSLLIIGGIDFASVFEKPWVEKNQDQQGVVSRIMSTVRTKQTAGGEEESLEDSLEKAAPLPEALDPDLLAELPSPDEPLTCVVYGFMQDGEQDFGRILLASNIKGARVHVGVMPATTLPRHVRQNLAARFSQIVADKPSVASSYRGNWVRPTIGLNIEFDGWSGGGELINPAIYAPPNPVAKAATDAGSQAAGDN